MLGARLHPAQSGVGIGQIRRGCGGYQHRSNVSPGEVTLEKGTLK